MSVLYPIAANAEAALAQPVGRAARESEAASLAAGTVEFVSEAVGPAFATFDAARDAWVGRIDDDRPGPDEWACASPSPTPLFLEGVSPRSLSAYGAI